MKIIAIHNTLWTHYKGDMYSRIYKRLEATNQYDFSVIHLATTEHGRSVLGNADLNEHQYPYEVLFDTDLEKVSSKSKTTHLLKRVIYHRPQLIYLNGYYDVSYWAVIVYAKTKGIKIIIDSESNEQSRERIWWKESLKKVILTQLDGYLCLGTKATEYLLKLGIKKEKILSTRNIGIANDKVSALYKTAYAQRNHTKERLNLPQFNFIYAGRFNPIKNLKMLIEAFGEISQTHPFSKQWGLILSGDGTEKEDLKALVQSKKLANIFFLPSCEWHEVPARYALADVAVLPSLFEPFGFLVNEALVYGMPIIVSNRCGSAYDLVKDGENGFVFEPTLKFELMEKMQTMMNQSDNLKTMGQKGQKLVEKFHPDAICEDIINAFDTVLKP
ncbi:glycosyltransferase involved in cell wall biosynthesis [Arcicella aurantiaca]|uniref:Glycosyltransferase involved in cell wall biosynthesis n=1 Tax=Arcicella aurantiaca TaxID=591202 RepID=A0A316EB08_9BACT|nr:glycosyltransferase [Arcicella aurantiaca]PWK26746.1 glycosyltransferase involved in cell wall biosynthesis [Arcicella aurantiaca]